MTAYEIKKLVPDFWNKHKDKLIYSHDRYTWFDWDDLYRMDRDMFHNMEHARSVFTLKDDPVCYRRLATGEMRSLFRHGHSNFDVSNDCKISQLLYQKERQRAHIDEPFGAWIESVDKESNFGVKYLKGINNTKEVHTSVGKWLRQLDLLEDISDTNIEQYVNRLKAKYIIKETFSIVEGEDIRYWYHGIRYAYNTGSLDNSCMRHERCQEFLDIYVENDIKMLILTDQNGKLTGRALLWPKQLWNKNYFDNCDVFMDRIYGNDRVIQKFKDYAQEKGWARKSEQTYNNTLGVYFNGEIFTKRMRMNIEYDQHHEYPYMDTFNRLEDGCLKNHGEGTVLDSTEGGYSEPYAHCAQCGCTLQNEDDAYYCEHESDYYCEDHSVWSEWNETYIPYGLAIDTCDGWLYSHESVEDCNGRLHHEDNVREDVFGNVYSSDILYSITLNHYNIYVTGEDLLRDTNNDMVHMIIDGYRCKAINFTEEPDWNAHEINDVVQRIKYNGNTYVTTYKNMCNFIKLQISQLEHA